MAHRATFTVVPRSKTDPSPATWADYLRQFHDTRAGITDVVIGGARHRGISPYQWAVQALGDRNPVVDLACGSAPLHRLITSAVCIGVDSSPAELRLAARSGAGPLLLADSGHIPMSAASAAAVVCSMSLQILHPLERSLAEVARLLRPGGVFVALLPADGPLSLRDRYRYVRLLLALRRRRLSYPNDRALTDAGSLFQAHGLEIVRDERLRFGLDPATVGDALVRSLYLPGGSARRIEEAGRRTRGWAGHQLGIPVRRIVATRRN